MADEVDGILAAWTAQRPDLDVGPMAVFSRIDRLAALLAGRRAEVFARHQLLAYEFDVLAALRRSGEPYELTTGALCTLTHVTSGTMTNRVDRLVDRRWVRRRPDVADGRVVLVRITSAGRRRVDAALSDLLEVERSMLSPLTPTAAERLATSLRLLAEAQQPAPPT